MTQSPVTKQSKAKIQAKATALRDPINSPEIIVTRELNIYGKMVIFGVYTSVCLFLGGIFFAKSPTIDYAQLGDIQNEQQKLLVKLSDIENNSGSGAFQLAQTNKRFTKDLEQKIVGIINKRDTESSKIIENQREEINALNNQLKKVIDLNTHRSIASVNANKTISYNHENMSVLRYEHRLLKRKFKNNQNNLKEAFLLTIDLKTLEGKEQWQSFKDQQELALYAFEQDCFKKERDFRTKGYRVKN